jgi:hypothetical protein
LTPSLKTAIKIAFARHGLEEEEEEEEGVEGLTFAAEREKEILLSVLLPLSSMGIKDSNVVEGGEREVEELGMGSILCWVSLEGPATAREG